MLHRLLSAGSEQNFIAIQSQNGGRGVANSRLVVNQQHQGAVGLVAHRHAQHIERSAIGRQERRAQRNAQQ